MITIIVHGILSSSYQQKIVIDKDCLADNNIRSLKNVRNHLSYQYGDSTPLTGWAMQTAPDGIWLSRIERSFDTNYVPAYIMVSFLIPKGMRLTYDAILHIDRCLLMNHDKYIIHNIIVPDANWSFLVPLGGELENFGNYDHDNIVYNSKNTPIGCAYWPGNLISMLDNMWDSRFALFEIVYCDKRILSTSNKFVSINDIPVIDTPTSEKPENNTDEHIVNNDGYRKNNDDETDTYATYDSKDNSEEETANNSHYQQTTQNVLSQNNSHKKKHHKKLKSLLLLTGILMGFALLGVITAIYINKADNSSTNNNTSSTSKTNTPNIPIPESYATTVSNSEKNDYSSLEQEDNDTFTLTESSCEPTISIPTPNNKASNKTVIYSTESLLRILTWENVKDNGKLFYNQYCVSDDNLKKDADQIIKNANILGKSCYCAGYFKSKTKTNGVSYLKSYLNKSQEIN